LTNKGVDKEEEGEVTEEEGDVPAVPGVAIGKEGKSFWLLPLSTGVDRLAKLPIGRWPNEPLTLTLLVVVVVEVVLLLLKLSLLRKRGSGLEYVLCFVSLISLGSLGFLSVPRRCRIMSSSTRCAGGLN